MPFGGVSNISDPKFWFTIFDLSDFLKELSIPGYEISRYFSVDFEHNCPFNVLFIIAVLFALFEWWWWSGELLLILILNPNFFSKEFIFLLLDPEFVDIKFPNVRTEELFWPEELHSGMQGKFYLFS